MYIINESENTISEIHSTTFKDLKIEERKHLQEWILSAQKIFGEELLYIQKEFSNFHETNERLDLLALDKFGKLVVIENKLDDSGKEVIGQALKYTAYCSTLKKEQIIKIYQDYLNINSGSENAETNLCEFFGVDSLSETALNIEQRIILVAREFKKEITATVLWLNSSMRNLKIQCFKVTPFQFKEDRLLTFEQIIPIKDAEEFIIKMAEKTQENIEAQSEVKTAVLIRLEFWKSLLDAYKLKSNTFQSITPGKDSWLGVSAGISGTAFNFVISNSYARVELYFGSSIKEQNKFLFLALENRREEFESNFGNQLIWEEIPLKKSSRIKDERQEYNILDKDNWPIVIDYMCSAMFKLENTFRESLLKLKGKY